jgi:hypothetical protein
MPARSSLSIIFEAVVLEPRANDQKLLATPSQAAGGFLFDGNLIPGAALAVAM